jgi:hypothetical protein
VTCPRSALQHGKGNFKGEKLIVSFFDGLSDVEEWLTHFELHFQTRRHQPAPNAILKNTPTAINNATPELIKAADISLAMAFSSVETRPSPHIRIGGMSFNQRSFLEKL